MALDESFQRDVVAASTRDPLYRQRAARIAQPRHFDVPVLEWMWRNIIDLPPGEKYTARLAAAHAQRDYKDATERRELLEQVVKVFKHTPPHAAASLDELRRFIKFHNQKVGIQTAIKALDKADVDGAHDALVAATRMRDDMSYERAEWVGEMEARQKRREEAAKNPEESYVVPTRIRPLDLDLNGGLKPGDLGLIVGVTGVGKSHAAINLACQAAVQGFTVGLIDTENGLDLEMARLDAWFQGIDSARVATHDYTVVELAEIKARLAKQMGRLKGKLKVYHTPVRQATIHTVEQIIDEADLEGESFQLLVVDCGDHLKPNERNKELHRLDQANIFWDLKSIADERHIPVWSTSQASKEAVHRIATAENVSEAYDKARIATVILTVNQTRREANNGQGRLYLAKNRKGKGQRLIHVKIDKSISHIEWDEAREREMMEEEGKEEGEGDDE